MRIRWNPAVGLALALATPGAVADMMRCGEQVFDDSATQPATAAQVLAACGEPTSRDFGQWVYVQPGQFTRVVTFDSDGNLQSIRTQLSGD